jgi:hypothetical protein
MRSFRKTEEAVNAGISATMDRSLITSTEDEGGSASRAATRRWCCTARSTSVRPFERGRLDA